MSIRVMAWALKDVHINDAVAKLVLIGLADHAMDDGTASWPAQKVLAEYADVSTRTVRTKLRILEELGLIQPGDQELNSHLPANRRPQVWDLNMSPVGRKTVSGQKDLPGGRPFPPNLGARAEAPRHSGRKTVSDKPSLEPSLTEDSLRSSSAQTLVGEWIDHCNGSRPPSRVIGQVAKEVGIMLREGIPYADVRQGLAFWHSRGLHPSALASAVHEVRTANSGGLKSRRQLETDTQFDRMLARAREKDQRKELEQ